MASPRRGLLPALALALLAAVPALAAPDSGAGPIVVPAGARRTGDLVALGRPVSVEGELAGAAVATLATIRVTGRVAGHVVALGGDVTVGEGGRVEGDVLAVGGAVLFEGGASPTRSVGGQVRSLGALETAFLSELRTSPVAGARVSPLLLSFRLFLLLLWLLAALAFLRLAPRGLGRAADLVPGRLVLFGTVGTSAVLSGLLVSAGLLLLVPARAALALISVVVAALYAAKLWGLAVLFLVAGRRLLRGARRGGDLFGDPAALTAGLLALGLPSLIPAAGPILWALASLVAIGVTLRTLLVREEETASPAGAGEARGQRARAPAG